MNIFTVLLLSAMLAIGCPNKYHNLAVASDTISHALKDVDDATNIATEQGAMTLQMKAQFNDALLKASQSGLALDKAIRSAATTGADVQTQVDAFTAAFEQLRVTANTIPNANVKLTVNVSLTTLEGALAIVAAWPSGGSGAKP
jgi:hypothetical protein